MRKIFKWIYKPSGNCPVQAEGHFLGYFFYFRARWQSARIEFYNDIKDFEEDNFKEILFYTTLKNTRPYKAGYLSKRTCMFLVYKGCFLFLFSAKTNKNRNKLAQ